MCVSRSRINLQLGLQIRTQFVFQRETRGSRVSTKYIKLKILYLFPHHLNIYGDRGNILTLAYRAKKRGIDVEIVEINSRRDRIPNDINLIFGGGGQDKQQEYVSTELMFFKKEIGELIFGKKVSALLICGTYQLFGHYFRTEQGKEIPGISIFDMITVSSHVRKTGNVVVELNKRIFPDKKEHNFEVNCYHDIDHDSSKFNNLLVGFENHWGNTYLNAKCKSQNAKLQFKIKNFLKKNNIRENLSSICENPGLRGNNKQINSRDTQPLGTVISGFGNNGLDKTEGAIIENAIGTYLHGPLLPKNPRLADWLISVAVGHGEPLQPIDDTLELTTREKVIKSLFKI